jgi:hypothetical protein
MVLEQALGKTGQKPGFSTKFKETIPKLQFWNSLSSIMKSKCLSQFQSS